MARIWMGRCLRVILLVSLFLMLRAAVWIYKGTPQKIKEIPVESMYGVTGNTRNANKNGTRLSKSGTRIFCLILTKESTWDTKHRAVQLTWAKRCDKYCFFYTSGGRKTKYEPDACALHSTEGRGHLTDMVFEALDYASQKYSGTFDWILKADDDTYVIMDNLRKFLSHYDTLENHYFGRTFYHTYRTVPKGHNSGGAGYVLSLKALETLMSKGKCRQIGAVEDLDVAKCLSSYGIYPEDTKDKSGRFLFHDLDPLDTIYSILQHPNKSEYSYKKGNFTMGKGRLKFLSPDTVSFHRVTPEKMYLYDALLQDIIRYKPATS